MEQHGVYSAASCRASIPSKTRPYSSKLGIRAFPAPWNRPSCPEHSPRGRVCPPYPASRIRFEGWKFWSRQAPRRARSGAALQRPAMAGGAVEKAIACQFQRSGMRLPPDPAFRRDPARRDEGKRENLHHRVLRALAYPTSSQSLRARGNGTSSIKDRDFEHGETDCSRLPSRMPSCRVSDRSRRQLPRMLPRTPRLARIPASKSPAFEARSLQAVQPVHSLLASPLGDKRCHCNNDLQLTDRTAPRTRDSFGQR